VTVATHTRARRMYTAHEYMSRESCDLRHVRASAEVTGNRSAPRRTHMSQDTPLAKPVCSSLNGLTPSDLDLNETDSINST
jgi:hypothetical protein